MTKPTCRTCPYFNAFGDVPQCRRIAPVILALPAPSGKGININGYFPPVGPDVWCGQHPDFEAYVKFTAATPES